MERSSEARELVAGARRAMEAQDWGSVLEQLRQADTLAALAPDELELLADAARWAGEPGPIIVTLERAHVAFAAQGDERGAARTALALSLAHVDANEVGPAGSWRQRAVELLSDGPECAETALLCWLEGRAYGDGGDLDEHEAHARRALAIAEREKARNVEALALLDLGHLAAARGETAASLAFIDRATGIALSGDIGHLETGVVLCGAVWTSRSCGEWSRAEEWTRTTDRWCRRVKVSYFPGLCRVHRAEVLRASGDLRAAEEESCEAIRLLEAQIPRWAAIAHAELGEVRRRLGEFGGAMEAFRKAIGYGWDPQPGLALLMLAQGDADSAHRSIERTFAARLPTWLLEDQANLLRARATIAIAAGDEHVARDAVERLEAGAARNVTDWERASAACARGELALWEGDAPAAITALREAKHIWSEIATPYEMATASALLGRALAAECDDRSAAIELEAARACFERIGAAFDAARIASPGAADSECGAVASGDSRFLREGDVWTMTYRGRTVRLKATRGFEYLARLLAQPGRDVACIELVSNAAVIVPPEADLGEVLDPEARAAYRERLADLEAALEEARRNNDTARVDAVATEMDALRKELEAALGLGGRPRRGASAAERARQSVTKALRGAVRRIAEEHPALGRHLDSSLRTGALCRYDPESSVPWEITG